MKPQKQQVGAALSADWTRPAARLISVYQAGALKDHVGQVANLRRVANPPSGG